MKTKRQIFWLVGFCALLLAACDTLMAGFQQGDPQSATLTALVPVTQVAPTLDLKGNRVIEPECCEPYRVVCVSLIEDRLNGGIMKWAPNAPILAYTAPKNRYWAWFSGDAVLLDFSEDAAAAEHPGEVPRIIPPQEYSTTEENVFGNYVFNSDHSRIAYTALRQSEKLYTVMSAKITENGFEDVRDLFPGLIAETDEFSSDKSVIEWVNKRDVRAASSCGIDCELIYRINTETGRMTEEDEVRKHGHNGRVRADNVIDYDDRDYPVMNQMNWSPDERYVFYRDNRWQAWILKEGVREQYPLDIKGRGILQTLWSNDSRYLAIRYEDNIQIIRVDCRDGSGDTEE